MRIAGFIKNSFIDFPGLISCVVFTSGCNMNCWYCHNRELISGGQARVREDEIVDFLAGRRGQIDGVVISGGEPCLQPDLRGFIERVRGMGFKIKLDTNGMLPDVLGGLLGAGLLDFVAMDIKAPLDKYNAITGTSADICAIKASIELIMNEPSHNPTFSYEFRTTFVPQLTQGDAVEIARTIAGAECYAIAQYKKDNVSTGVSGYTPYSHTREYLHKAAEQASKFVKRVIVRGA